MTQDSPPTGDTASFVATIEHAVRLHKKATMLEAQTREAMAVALGVFGRGDIPHHLVLWAGDALKHAGVPGRMPIVNAGRKVLARPGQRFLRPRGSQQWWPIAPAWVYLLKQEEQVIYIGATERIGARIAGHGAKHWTHIELIACEDRHSAWTLEGDLIFQHFPPLNKADTKRRRFVA